MVSVYAEVGTSEPSQQDSDNATTDEISPAIENGADDSVLIEVSVPDAVKQVRKEFEDSIGNGSPTLEVFHRTLLETSQRLTDGEYGMMFGTLLMLQKPALTAEQVNDLRHAVRDSITSFHCTWAIRTTKGHGASTSRRQAFWMQDEQLRFDRHTVDESGTAQTVVRSYDGKSEVVYESHKVHSQAMVHNLVGRQFYFTQYNPLLLSWLASPDSDLANGSQAAARDFAARGAYPLQGTMVFAGVECMAFVEHSGLVYYFDPAMNFAFRGYESGRYVFNASTGRLEEADSRFTEVHRDFLDLGNGLWLPQTIEQTRQENGTVELNQVIAYSDYQVNQPLDASTFRVDGSVQDGVEVIDGQRNVRYLKGDEFSVVSTLNRTIPPRSPQPLKSLLLWGNFAAIVVIGALYYAKSRRK